MSTRAATKQQELEEQLAKLIGMMGQQQERQEQQQERQEAKLIGMMEQQREQQEWLASEQQQWQKELAHQQEQQLEQLVEKQWANSAALVLPKGSSRTKECYGSKPTATAGRGPGEISTSLTPGRCPGNVPTSATTRSCSTSTLNQYAQPVPPPRRIGRPRNPPQRYGYAIEPIATEPMVEPPETCVFKRGTV